MAKIDRRCPYRVIKEDGKPDEYGKCYTEGCPYFVNEHWDINKCRTVPAICRKVEREMAAPVQSAPIRYYDSQTPRII